MPLNYSLHTIPVYWIVALAPHAYAVSIARKANNGVWDNVNPRNTAYLSQHVSKEALAVYERAEAAHQNGMENAPFFVGAVLAGNLAGLSAATMNAFAGGYLACRVLYNVLYIRTTTLKKSRARSLLWIASTISLIVLYVKAGNKMLARS